MNIERHIINQQIIIIEGHDGGGKTTISKELSNILNIPRFKYTQCEEHFAAKYDFLLRTYFDQSMFIEFLEQTGYSIILDRCYPSEWVYSKVFARPMDEIFIDELDKKYAKLNTKIVICEKKNFIGEFKDDYVKISEIVSIKKIYRRFINFTECETLLLDTAKQDLNGDIKKIIKFIGE